MMKMFRFAVVLLLLSSLFAGSVFAAPVPVTVEKVWLNERDVTSGEVRGDILRGDSVDIEVKLRATSNADNLKVTAEISGFEHDDDDDIRDESDLFDVKSGQVYFKKLSLRLPSDLDQDTYAVRIEVSDRRNQKVTWDATLDVNTARHSVDIEDVAFSPGLTVKAGRSLLASVRVENNGEKDEDSVKVTLSIPSLGVSDSDFMDELESDDEKTSEELFVRIPECAEEGDYPMTVSVLYNDERKRATQDYTLRVLENENCVKAPEKSGVFTLAPESRDAAPGSEVSYEFVLTNTGSESKTYTVSASAGGDWATTRVSSSVLVVGAGETKLGTVYVTPKQDAQAGQKLVTVNVKSGEQTVKDVAVRLNVLPSQNNGGSGIVGNLQIGLIVLLVLIVIVGLVVGFSKRKEEGKEEETYY